MATEASPSKGKERSSKQTPSGCHLIEAISVISGLRYNHTLGKMVPNL